MAGPRIGPIFGLPGPIGPPPGVPVSIAQVMAVDAWYTDPYAYLPLAPTPGNTLVMAISEIDGFNVPISSPAWTQVQADSAYDPGQYGGPGPRSYLSIYTRLAQIGDTDQVAQFVIGSGLNNVMHVLVYEIAGASYVSSDMVTGTYVPGDGRDFSTVVGSTSVILGITGWQRTDYAPLDTWTLVSGTNDYEAPTSFTGLRSDSNLGTGSLPLRSTINFNPNLNQWGYAASKVILA